MLFAEVHVRDESGTRGARLVEVENRARRDLRARGVGAVGGCERHVRELESGTPGVFHALVGERRIAPTLQPVVTVEFSLAMTHQKQMKDHALIIKGMILLLLFLAIACCDCLRVKGNRSQAAGHKQPVTGQPAGIRDGRA